MVGFFNQNQQKKIHVKNTLPGNAVLNVDLTKMIICVKNIVQNAFKYGDSDKGVNVLISRSQKSYRIEVQDFGPGVSEEDKNHIFESLNIKKD